MLIKKIAYVSFVLSVLMFTSAFVAVQDSEDASAVDDANGAADLGRDLGELLDMTVITDSGTVVESSGSSIILTVDLTGNVKFDVDKDAIFDFVSQFRMLEIAGYYVVSDGVFSHEAMVNVFLAFYNQMYAGIKGDAGVYTILTAQVSSVDNNGEKFSGTVALHADADAKLVNSLNYLFSISTVNNNSGMMSVSFNMNDIYCFAHVESFDELSDMTVRDAYLAFMQNLSVDDFGNLSVVMEFLSDATWGEGIWQALSSLAFTDSVGHEFGFSRDSQSTSIFQFIAENMDGDGWDVPMSEYCNKTLGTLNADGILSVSYSNPDGSVRSVSQPLALAVLYPALEDNVTVDVAGHALTEELISEAIKTINSRASEGAVKTLEITTDNDLALTISNFSLWELSDSGIGISVMCQNNPYYAKVDFDAATVRSMFNKVQLEDLIITVATGDYTIPGLTQAQQDVVQYGTAVKVVVMFGSSVYHGNLGGDVQVHVGYSIDKSEYNDLRVYCVSDDGSKELVDSSYDSVNGCAVFSTKHFSVFLMTLDKDSFDYPLFALLLGAAIAIVLIAVLLHLRRLHEND